MIGTTIECIAYLSSQPERKYEVKPYHEKRSLSANALYWSCVNQLAKALCISNACMHNQLLRKYGPHLIIDGEEVFVALPDTEKAERQIEEDEINHFLPTRYKDKSKRWYVMLKPSHEFDAAEMSRLIEGVADEMRICGLVPPQDEIIQKAIEQYERKNHV